MYGAHTEHIWKKIRKQNRKFASTKGQRIKYMKVHESLRISQYSRAANSLYGKRVDSTYSKFAKTNVKSAKPRLEKIRKIRRLHLKQEPQAHGSLSAIQAAESGPFDFEGVGPYDFSRFPEPSIP